MGLGRIVRRALIGALLGVAGVALAIGAWNLLHPLADVRAEGDPPVRVTPVFDPPVLAGRPLWGPCSGGFYARMGETIVVTSTGHCTAAGTVAYEADGRTVRGVFGPPAVAPSCDVEGKTCAASDMNYLVVAEDRIPWGHLNMVDMGTGGYRTWDQATRPLRCEDVRIGDTAEINGRDVHRTGEVAEKAPYDHREDVMRFPCMIAARIQVTSGDSGGAVLVNGQPAGVTSRSFGGWLGFTPLAEGLEQLGLELCTTADCGLTPPR
jgi:hypothetical protein